MNILISGDFCPRDRVAEAFENSDYSSVLGEFVPIIKETDYSIVNLECPVVTADAQPIEKVGPNLKTSVKGVEALKWAGFNCVTLANNHILDYGDEGLRQTIEALDSAGIEHVGGGVNLNEASKILYKTIGDETLAIINCCEHEFSIASENSAGSNPLNIVKQYHAIKEAKQKADYVLVIVHGGHEHWQLPSLRMVEAYRFFIDAGADAVVNHHQHCFGGYEVYNGRPIFYGLGNFCFDNPEKRKGIWTEGYAVTIDFNKERIGYTRHPYTQCAESPSIKLQPGGIYDGRIKELNDIIQNEKALKEQNSNYYRRCSEQYENAFEPIRNRWYLGAKRRGWLPSLISGNKKLLLENFIVCESHLDKVIWWITSRD